MRVLFTLAYYYPETCAGLYIIDNIVEKCSSDNIEAIISVPTPSRNVDPNVNWHTRESIYNGKVQINRFRLFKEKTNPVVRAIRYFICEIIQLWICLTRDYDILFLDSTPPIQGLKLPIIKLFRRKPVVFNVQDLFPESLVGTSLAKKDGLLWKIGTFVMKISYKCSDKIIVISNDFKKRLLELGVREEKISVVYNWVEQNIILDIPRERNTIFDKYHLDRDKFYIEYSGNIGLTQNMEMLLEVMSELKDSNPEIMLIIIGEGVYKSQVEKTIIEKKLNNVILLPYQPYKDISFVFSLGDVGLVISKPGVGANSVPSKTWSIMSAGRPVLASFDKSELMSIIEDNECGIFTTAGDKEAFKKSILLLQSNTYLCHKYGRNGRKYIVKNLTREVGTNKYLEIFKSYNK